MSDVKQLAAKAALNKMMSGGFFDICTIDSIANLFNVIPENESYTILRTLHCVHFNQMQHELYANIPALIKATFSGAPLFKFDLHTETPLLDKN